MARTRNRQQPSNRAATRRRPTDAQLAERWKAALPYYAKWMLMSLCAVAVTVLLPLVVHLVGTPMKLLNFAFQLGLVMTGCFALLTLVALLQSRKPSKA